MTRLRGSFARLARVATVAHPSIVLALVGLAAAPLACGQRSFAQSSPQDELTAAATAQHSAHYEDAVHHYRNFLASIRSSVSPSTVAEARTDLATALFMLHRYDESLESLQPLIPSNPEATHSDAEGPAATPARPKVAIPAQAWLVRGLDCLELARPGDINRLSDATSSLRRALELNPASGTARMALGDALARSGHLEEAAEEYRQQLRRHA